MAELRTQLRRSGGALAAVIPAAFVRKYGLKAGDEVLVAIDKKPRLRGAFGMFRGTNLDAQRFKDEVRAEEYRAERRKWGER